MPRIIQIIGTTAKYLRNTVLFNEVIDVPRDPCACCNMFIFCFMVNLAPEQ